MSNSIPRKVIVVVGPTIFSGLIGTPKSSHKNKMVERELSHEKELLAPAKKSHQGSGMSGGCESGGEVYIVWHRQAC